MEKDQQVKTKSDATVLTTVFAIALILIAAFAEGLGSFRIGLMMFVVFSLVAASMGKQRKIGFVSAFFLSFFLSPIIGIIITLNSPKLEDEQYKEKMLEIAENNSLTSAPDITEQLYRLNELRKDGALTDEEFNEQKQKLLKA